MGNVSSIFNRLLSKRKRVLILGLDAVGKATILYNLRCDGNITPSPTVGFGVETENFKNINFTVWDLGGHVMLRPLLRQYFPNTDAIIFVVDCNDRDRVVEARDELHRMLGEDELKGASLLVLANKQVRLPGRNLGSIDLSSAVLRGG